MWEGGGGVNREGGFLTFFPLKGGGKGLIWEREI